MLKILISRIKMVFLSLNLNVTFVAQIRLENTGPTEEEGSVTVCAEFTSPTLNSGTITILTSTTGEARGNKNYNLVHYHFVVPGRMNPGVLGWEEGILRGKR